MCHLKNYLVTCGNSLLRSVCSTFFVHSFCDTFYKKPPLFTCSIKSKERGIVATDQTINIFSVKVVHVLKTTVIPQKLTNVHLSIFRWWMEARTRSMSPMATSSSCILLRSHVILFNAKFCVG